MNLVISSKLSTDPPSEGLMFRYITMEAKQNLEYTVVIEAEKKAEDYYYNFLKEKGWFDFVEDFVQPEWRVEGVRIDTELNYPMTIQVPYIRCENTPNILGQIQKIKNVL